jgi:hypothetical protein
MATVSMKYRCYWPLWPLVNRLKSGLLPHDVHWNFGAVFTAVEHLACDEIAQVDGWGLELRFVHHFDRQRVHIYPEDGSRIAKGREFEEELLLVEPCSDLLHRSDAGELDLGYELGRPA